MNKSCHYLRDLNYKSQHFYNHVIPSGFKSIYNVFAIIMSSLRDSKYKSQHFYNHVIHSGL
jgi:hypothetical protein